MPYIIDIEGNPEVVTIEVLCYGVLLVGPKSKRFRALPTPKPLNPFFSFGFLSLYFNVNSFQLETVYFLLLTLVKSGLGELLLFTHN